MPQTYEELVAKANDLWKKGSWERANEIMRQANELKNKPAQQTATPQAEQDDPLTRDRADALKEQIEFEKLMQQREEQSAAAINRPGTENFKVVKVIPNTDNGVVYQKPNGQLLYASASETSSDQEQIKRILEGAAPEAAARTSMQKEIMQTDPLRAYSATALQGIPFVGQWIDEATGAVMGDPRYTQAMRETQQAAMEQEPGYSTAAQVGMGVASTLPAMLLGKPLEAVKSAPTLLQGMATVGAKGAVAGGVEGAISGLGAGEGDFMQRLPSAGTGAMIGGALGGTIGALSEPARFAIKNMRQYFSNAPVRQLAKDLGISEDAAKVLRLYLQEGDIESARAALNRAGSKSMLAEVSQGTKNLLDAAIKFGSGSGEPLKALELRAITSNEELKNGLNRFFGEPRDIVDITTGVKQATEEARENAYRIAYGTPINYNSISGRNLVDLAQHIPQDVIETANRLIQSDPRITAKPPPIKLKVSKGGAPAASAAAPVASASAATSELDAFLRGKQRNSNITIGNYNAYLRKGMQVDEGGKGLKTLEVGSIERAEGADNVPGNFGEIMRSLERAAAQNGLDAVYVENVISDFLPGVLERYGYSKMPSSVPGAPSFIKRVGKSAQTKTGRSIIDETDAFSAGRRIRGFGIEDFESEMLPDTPQFETPPTVMQWDYIARALQEKAQAQKAGLMGGKSQFASNYDATRRAIRNELKTQIPEYKTALGISGDTIAEQQAAELGTELLTRSTTVGEIKRFLANAERPEIDRMKEGVRSYIDETLGNLRVRAANPNTDIKELEAALSMLRSRNNKSKISALLGDAEADEFYKMLDEQATSVELLAAVAQNSKTAQLQALKQNVEEVIGSGILGQIGRGKVINTQEMLVQSMTGLTPEADAARRMGLFDDIASVLTRLQGQPARDALELIERARKGKVLSDAQARIVAKQMTKPAALAIYSSSAAAVRAGEERNRIRQRAAE